MADLARRVRALERRQVEHRHSQPDALLLGGRLDRALAELRGALLDPDSVDMGQSPDHDCEATTLRGVKRVLVFCGSSPGGSPEYAAAAAELGGCSLTRELEIVYGGASVGLMGALADATLAAGGKVIGVIPNRLVEREIAHAGLTKLHIVETMHERKALMAELSDAVIALPGGTGTLDELFELFTWNQLGLHRKPIGPARRGRATGSRCSRSCEHAVDERFLRAEHLATLIVSQRPRRAARRLASHQHRALDKWLDRAGRCARRARRGDQVVPNTRSPASPNPGRM